MSDLSNIERLWFERLLGMSTGYVLNFTDRAFNEFVLECTGKDISDPKYKRASGSKANRLRAFWSVEPNHIVGKLLEDLLKYSSELGINPKDQQLFENCRRAVQRLLQSTPVPEIEVITENLAEKDLTVLSKIVREAIDKNQPESGLDRLHTFALKYMRLLCQKHGIKVDRNKPLHSLVGEYVRHLKKRGEIASEMTERILKSSISTLEAFNQVRNDQSLAHDNPLLNYDESILIYKHVMSVLEFINTIERRLSVVEKQSASEEDNFPF